MLGGGFAGTFGGWQKGKLFGGVTSVLPGGQFVVLVPCWDDYPLIVNTFS